MKTVKERIESIGREVKRSGPAIAYIKVGVQDARMLVYLAEEHGQLTSENARLRKALEDCSQNCESPRTVTDIAEEALRIGEESNTL